MKYFSKEKFQKVFYLKILFGNLVVIFLYFKFFDNFMSENFQ